MLGNSAARARLSICFSPADSDVANAVSSSLPAADFAPPALSSSSRVQVGVSQTHIATTHVFVFVHNIGFYFGDSTRNLNPPPLLSPHFLGPRLSLPTNNFALSQTES